MFEHTDNLYHIYAKDLLKIINDTSLIIIDIREPFELEESSIPTAKNIPMNMLLNNISSILKRDQEYYILCHTGQRSYYVTKTLQDLGYLAINIIGGIAQMPRYNHAKSSRG